MSGAAAHSATQLPAQAFFTSAYLSVEARPRICTRLERWRLKPEAQLGVRRKRRRRLTRCRRSSSEVSGKGRLPMRDSMTGRVRSMVGARSAAVAVPSVDCGADTHTHT